MFCKQCGAQLKDDVIFCSKCGAPVKDLQTTYDSPAPPQVTAPPKKKKPIYKRVWFWVIIAVLVIGVIGSLVSEDEPADKTTPEIVSPSPEIDASCLMSAEVKTADVMNGAKTEKIGERAYIEVPKAELKSVTPEEFLEFTTTRVDGSGYNWWSIICDDGTGIQFSGSMSYVSDYGELDDEGCITNARGYITADSDKGTVEYEEAEQETPASTQAINTPTGDTSLDGLKSLIETVLSSGFDDYTVEAEDNMITVCIFYDGIAMELAAIKDAGGNADDPQWVELKNNLLTLSESIQNVIDTAGREDVVLSLNLMNDVNRDNVLLTFLDSVVFYDALA